MTTQDHIEQFKKEFYQETKEIVDTISDDLLKLETDPADKSLLNSLFRGIHTIKGSAGSFELDSLSNFTHHLEGLLNVLRDGKIPLSSDMVDVILAGIDHISSMITSFEAGEKAHGNAELEAQFKAFYFKPTADHEKTPQEDTPSKILPEKSDLSSATGRDSRETRRMDLSDYPLSNSDIKKLEEAVNQGKQIFQINVNYSSEHLEHGYDPLVFLKNVKAQSDLFIVMAQKNPVSGLDDFEPFELYLQPRLIVAGILTLDALFELSFDPSLIDVKNLVEDIPPDGKLESFFSIDSEESLKEFIEGTSEMLDEAEQAAITYESKHSESALNQIFRVVHTIKGDADFMGFVELTRFAHSFETLLEKLRQKSLKPNSKIVDLVLKSVDFLRLAIQRLADNGGMISKLPPIYHALKSYEKEQHQEIESEHPLSDVPEEVRDVFIEQIIQCRQMLQMGIEQSAVDETFDHIIQRALEDLKISSGVVNYKPLIQSTEAALAILGAKENQADKIKLTETITRVFDDIHELVGEPKKLGEILISDGKIEKASLDETLAQQKPIGQMLVDSGKVSKEDVDQALKKQQLMETARQKGADETLEPSIRTMRVDETKVEQFSNLVGEMLIARNTYAFLLSQLELMDVDVKETVKSLKENLHLFSRLTNDVHHGVISLRMIPIKGIFQKFTRVVRDISRKQKKMIEIVTDGEDIEIDKKISDALSDPMVHLIRNACDHGIESPLERKKAGKLENGTVLLKASKEGGNICIRIIDDGRGINRAKLFEKSKETGAEISSVDDPALLDMIFLPGLSTAEQITDVSGRGVGMDVVKTSIQSLGGNIQVLSDEGKGTEITLSIPTTMGIDTVLFVESSGKSYAIPIDYILETLKISPDRIRKAGHQMMIHYRGAVLPVFYLDYLLTSQVNGSALKDETQKDAEISIVILKTSQGKFGIIIDRFDKNMEIAVKPLPDVLSGLDVVSGVSILGNGKVLLVLNPDQFAGYTL